MKTKFNTHKICTIAMLVAIAFVLGALSIRIGAGIKISFKFLPVFLFAPACTDLFMEVYAVRWLIFCHIS